MALSPGTRLGAYEVVALLGAGGMGEVYRVVDTRLNRTVAIKVLPEHVSSDPERRERFTQEAQIISSLNHPNICALYGVGVQDRIQYLVMEHVDGETLHMTLATTVPTPPDVVCGASAGVTAFAVTCDLASLASGAGSDPDRARARRRGRHAHGREHRHRGRGRPRSREQPRPSRR